MFLGLVGVTGAIGYAMTGAGCGALAFIFFPKLPRIVAALLGGLSGPLVLAVAVLIGVSITPGGPTPGPLIAGLAIICGPGIVIGWPCAFLTLRVLHRRIERAGATAQEIFQ